MMQNILADYVNAWLRWGKTAVRSDKDRESYLRMAEVWLRDAAKHRAAAMQSDQSPPPRIDPETVAGESNVGPLSDGQQRLKRFHGDS
jgi:hypothetical protein